MDPLARQWIDGVVLGSPVATVIHRTRSATNADVQVSDASGRLVASGQVSSRILH